MSIVISCIHQCTAQIIPLLTNTLICPSVWPSFHSPSSRHPIIPSLFTHPSVPLISVLGIYPFLLGVLVSVFFLQGSLPITLFLSLSYIFFTLAFTFFLNHLLLLYLLCCSSLQRPHFFPLPPPHSCLLSYSNSPFLFSTFPYSNPHLLPLVCHLPPSPSPSFHFKSLQATSAPHSSPSLLPLLLCCLFSLILAPLPSFLAPYPHCCIISFILASSYISLSLSFFPFLTFFTSIIPPFSRLPPPLPH